METTPTLPVELGPVDAALLRPLFGRAVETRRGLRGLVHDPTAVAMGEGLAYDGDALRHMPGLAGVSLRTRVFDEEVRSFLGAYPRGSVVEIGAGLGTRFERLGRGRAHWLEIDDDEPMSLRRRFLGEDPRRRQLALSPADLSWLDAAADLPRPLCFVAEGSFSKLDPETVKATLWRLRTRFPGSWLVMDTASEALRDLPPTHALATHYPEASDVRWTCDDPHELRAWGLRLHRSRSFFELPPKVEARIPWRFRVLLRWFPWLVRDALDGYRINLFVLGAGGEGEAGERREESW